MNMVMVMLEGKGTQWGLGERAVRNKEEVAGHRQEKGASGKKGRG